LEVLAHADHGGEVRDDQCLGLLVDGLIRLTMAGASLGVAHQRKMGVEILEHPN
jgi:hypothetical protein